MLQLKMSFNVMHGLTTSRLLYLLTAWPVWNIQDSNNTNLHPNSSLILPEGTALYLSQQLSPFYPVVFIGQSRAGKSLLTNCIVGLLLAELKQLNGANNRLELPTHWNQLLIEWNGEWNKLIKPPFKVSNSTNACTHGVDVIAIPYFDHIIGAIRGSWIILDAEGLDSVNSSQINHEDLLAISSQISTLLVYADQPNFSKRTIKSLGRLIGRSIEGGMTISENNAHANNANANTNPNTTQTLTWPKLAVIVNQMKEELPTSTSQEYIRQQLSSANDIQDPTHAIDRKLIREHFGEISFTPIKYVHKLSSNLAITNFSQIDTNDELAQFQISLNELFQIVKSTTKAFHMNRAETYSSFIRFMFNQLTDRQVVTIPSSYASDCFAIAEEILNESLLYYQEEASRIDLVLPKVNGKVPKDRLKELHDGLSMNALLFFDYKINQQMISSDYTSESRSRLIVKLNGCLELLYIQHDFMLEIVNVGMDVETTESAAKAHKVGESCRTIWFHEDISERYEIWKDVKTKVRQVKLLRNDDKVYGNWEVVSDMKSYVGDHIRSYSQKTGLTKGLEITISAVASGVLTFVCAPAGVALASALALSGSVAVVSAVQAAKMDGMYVQTQLQFDAPKQSNQHFEHRDSQSGSSEVEISTPANFGASRGPASNMDGHIRMSEVGVLELKRIGFSGNLESLMGNLNSVTESTVSQLENALDRFNVGQNMILARDPILLSASDNIKSLYSFSQQMRNTVEHHSQLFGLSRPTEVQERILNDYLAQSNFNLFNRDSLISVKNEMSALLQQYNNFINIAEVLPRGARIVQAANELFVGGIEAFADNLTSPGRLANAELVHRIETDAQKVREYSGDIIRKFEYIHHQAESSLEAHDNANRRSQQSSR